MSDEHGHDRLEGTRRQHEQQGPRPMTEPTKDSGMSRTSVAACPVSSWR